MRGRKAGLGIGVGTAGSRCADKRTMGIDGSGIEALFLRLVLLVCVTNEPPSIKAEPMTCRTVNFSCRIATASIIATATCSWTTGAARLTPMSWLDL